MGALLEFITVAGDTLKLNKSQEVKFDNDVIIAVDEGVLFVKHYYNNGESRIINVLKSGSVQYIESSYMSIKAKSKMRMKIINKDFFNRNAGEESKKDLRQLITILYSRMNMTIRDTSFQEKSLNLIACLVKLANTFGLEKENGILIDLDLTHKELAELSMLTRETVSRNMKKLYADKLLIYKSKKIFILNLDCLRSKLKCENCPSIYCAYG
ncbi:Crp/Fnr family transcriptional regulator [Staphylococcus coagulans]|uniref:Crp/Fnr family transcriptional regulator n=2 Tax=Staphylococcus coagulans TaxID=74706 RepID=UPI00067E0CFD|nr:Crp/Fnr family transcriptional regulator [Staphylococcus coagulans]MBT2813735.1 Crp/Fnr family transcriptional regulator [Staphylococcus coagulans]MBT2815998.1 Crp/Fnr family transcriptional regulator [Staphylococcus coagulans]MBT2836613.1 Crp/Fnr family transcriptional regulator [Staphylococcus coagulans]MBT2841141.1 Crp/Fnr family transcriptional regulator [Staphylococcus coagulans]MBT2847960.1 Crp/Fnr family transcriptional regulator [Staphylococcus coagulans]